ncbi:MAG: PAS domain S-box protein [Deltaproteobacteria bacterium]|nr:PAS domain S-box protein [Deltaproteobacteria bacterium]
MTTSLHDKLSLLTLFRLIVALVFLGAAFLFGFKGDLRSVSVVGRELIYGGVCILLLLCVVAAFLLDRWLNDERRLVLLAYTHFVGDALFATTVILLTGGTDSIFTFFYSLAIINASIILYRQGALFTASFNSICLGAVGAGQMDLLGADFRSLLATGPLFGGATGVPSDIGGVLPGLIVNTLAFFGIAMLASFLAEQMRAADTLAREHKRGFDALANLHESIVSNIESGLLTVDGALTVTYVNHTVTRLLGRSREELVGSHVRDVFPEIAPVLENPDKAGTAHSETTTHVAQGRRWFLRWSISPLRDDVGKRVGTILLFFDLTRTREMEEEVKRSEQMAALGRMAANIAHEIRNPLASMSGSIQLLSDSLQVSGAEKKLMDIVVRETEHLNRWITEFLDFARPRQPHPEPIDVAELAHEVLQILQHDEQASTATLEILASGDSVTVGDRARFRQIIWNLVLNAIQASGPTAEILVYVDGTPPDQLVVKVQDNGPGIDPEVLARIFEPFFTTKPGGTGLGLAAVHRNVSEQGGTISVHRREPGPGTVFVITFQRRRPPADGAELGL